MVIECYRHCVSYSYNRFFSDTCVALVTISSWHSGEDVRLRDLFILPPLMFVGPLAWLGVIIAALIDMREVVVLKGRRDKS